MCQSNVNFWSVRRLFTKSFNFLTEWGLTDKVFRKTALHRRRCSCCVCKPFIWRERLTSDSVLGGFRELHCCGTVRQKPCSAKLTLGDFEACTLFQKQVPSGRLSIFRYLSRLSLFYLSDVWSLSRSNSNVFRENFPLFDFVTGDSPR